MPEETKPKAAPIPPRQGGKSIEERVAFALAHRTRVYVLTLLNEGVYSPDELARIIGEPVGNIAHHIKQLLDADSIELAKTETRRNTLQHFYRAVEMPFYSDEEIEAMTPEERQATIGLTLQCLMAEIMTAFWSGKMQADPRLWLSWRWFNVDEQGRQDLADEQERSWRRAQEIEAEAAARCTQSGDETQSIIVAAAGFERERSAPTAPPPSNFSER
ncbi:MAG TPA: winged helix-turn-helix domain-containing protein [Solirubrobacterales bacterium]